MSKIKLEGNASGSGTLTISAPNTNTDRSLTLPDSAGEILTDGSSISSSQLTGDAVPIGVDQTWTDVTSSRSKNTTYTNTTGRPIIVSVVSAYASDNDATLNVDSKLVSSYINSSGSLSTQFTATAVVPDDSTYVFSQNQGTVNKWFELR